MELLGLLELLELLELFEPSDGSDLWACINPSVGANPAIIGQIASATQIELIPLSA